MRRLPALSLLPILAACSQPLPEAPRTLVYAAPAGQTEPSAPQPAASPPLPRHDDRAMAAFRQNGLRPIGGATGFFVDAAGHVLTNAHVTAPCAALSLETTDGTEYPAGRIDADAAVDLALVETNIAAPAVVAFRDKVRLDDRPVALIGYPNHGLQRITPEMGKGELSGPLSPDGRHFVIRADARPGNSGGPLFEQSGLVDGVIYGKINSVAVYQETGKSVGNISFVITNETVRAFLAARGVTPQVLADAPRLDDQTLFDTARQAVVRMVCWQSKRT